ncbi:MAG: FMN-binding protein [Paludibacteraceae bacterium]|nr:FMN-binding protein [Paludibacteraceae bacterium]
MAKLESSFKNMVLSLTAITLVAAAGLAGVYMVTKAQIEAQNIAAQNAAKIAVLNGQEGTAIEAVADGFGGPIRIMVGFANDGTILGYEVLEQQETPGLGTHMVEWFKQADKPGQCIVGRQANGQFTVSKDGGDVDAITAATISSRAFLKAVNSAYADWKAQQGEQVEAWSGASQQQGKEENNE